MVDKAIEDAIAIIGMAARFPGGYDCDGVWPVLAAGETTETRFERAELDPALHADVVDASNYVPVRGILPGIEDFDADYFAFTRAEAEIMDPQQRLFLELAVHALENAGYYRETRARSIGVYAGMSNVTYFRNHLVRRPDVLARVGEINAMMGNEKDYLATRIAHKLDLTGPCLNISTACSTSAVAIAQAFHALQTYQCDLALAGGVSVVTPQNRGYHFQEGGILSPDGHCRPFDARAQGTFFSNGGGIVVLKRLGEALEDGDTIAAVIRGVGVNNDGARRASFAAPGIEGQAEAIAQALAHAEVSAEDIGYVEAHGTATPIGDPIEVEALRLAYSEYTGRRGYCALGSIKGNLGHLDVAAGVAGVIKIALAMQHRTIPPTAHFRTPNPQLQLDNTPFYVNAERIDWPAIGGTRLAGLSSFGSGGTNAHLVLQEAPPQADVRTSETAWNVTLLSARNDRSLGMQARGLERYVAAHSGLALTDIARTLRFGRQEDDRRVAVVADGTDVLQAGLTAAAARLERREAKNLGLVRKKLAFVFPGQGAQYRGMGRELYTANADFRDALDRCFALFDEHMDVPLRDVLFAEDADDDRINRTEYTQPALFSVGYALARVYERARLVPDAMIGHSIGEYVAACLAGVFSPEVAAAIVARRAQLMQSMAPGAMLSIATGEEQVGRYLSDSVEIASCNTPTSTVVAGDCDAIAELELQLAREEVPAKRVRTSHAFHSYMMNDAADALAEFVATQSLERPRLPFVSTVTGDWIDADDAVDPAYWGRQIRRPVRFSQAVSRLVDAGPYAFLELGPRKTSTSFIRRHIRDVERHAATAGMDVEAGSVTEPQAYLNALARLWEQGQDVDWDAVVPHEVGRRIPLPGYAFTRKRCWIDVVAPETEAVAPPADTAAETVPAGAGGWDRALRELIAETIGTDAADVTPEKEFMELGFDSLMLTQLSIVIKRRFRVDIPFRRLLEDLTTCAALRAHLEANARTDVKAEFAAPERPVAAAPAPGSSAEPDAPRQKSRGASITRTRDAHLTAAQKAAIDRIVARYNERTRISKERTATGRGRLADPRTVSGFHPLWKEAVYPIMTTGSGGAYLHDIDGNRYIDFTCGFGPIMLGHNPPFLKEAMLEQIESGVETGPQTPLAHEVAQLIVQATGVERVAFASTGTEAVIAATRIARTVTARNKILVFAESYHGIHDEVTLNARMPDNALPGAPGIPRSNLQNVIVARYGSDDALDTVREHAHELAAVLVEPVQSRNPTLRPREFLHGLRALTQELDIALIFDEIVTGFRVALGGAQQMYGVRADIVTYGKVIGGGYPIGVVAGSHRYLDALDGGAWQFGDDSVPEVGVTFFAGTFVRHPLMLAAARATLRHLIDAGPALQETLNATTARFCERLGTISERLGAGVAVHRCSSWFTLDFADTRFAALFYVLMRTRGLFIWEGRALFLTCAHSEQDLDDFATAFEESLATLMEDELLARQEPRRRIRSASHIAVLDAARPPQPGARLGRDPRGRPGWYVEDPERPGQYRLLQTVDSGEGGP